MPGDRRHIAAEPGQGQGVLGPGLAGGEGVHRVTASASAAVRPGIWPGGSHEAPAVSAGRAAVRALWARRRCDEADACAPPVAPVSSARWAADSGASPVGYTRIRRLATHFQNLVAC